MTLPMFAPQSPASPSSTMAPLQAIWRSSRSRTSSSSTVMAKSQMPSIDSTPRSVIPSAEPPTEGTATSRSTSPSRSSRTMFVWKSAMRTSALRAGEAQASASASAACASASENTRTTMSKSSSDAARSTAMDAHSA